VELVCPSEARIFQEAPAYGVPVRALPIGKKRLPALKAMRAFLRDNRFDVINTHSSTDSWLAALACKMPADAPAHRSYPSFVDGGQPLMVDPLVVRKRLRSCRRHRRGPKRS
jgi:hypothetical protein